MIGDCICLETLHAFIIKSSYAITFRETSTFSTLVKSNTLLKGKINEIKISSVIRHTLYSDIMSMINLFISYCCFCLPSMCKYNYINSYVRPNLCLWMLMFSLTASVTKMPNITLSVSSYLFLRIYVAIASAKKTTRVIKKALNILWNADIKQVTAYLLHLTIQ